MGRLYELEWNLLVTTASHGIDREEGALDDSTTIAWLGPSMTGGRNVRDARSDGGRRVVSTHRTTGYKYELVRSYRTIAVSNNPHPADRIVVFRLLTMCYTRFTVGF